MLGKQSAADVRHWQWTEKGREGDTVTRVRICRLWELVWVVAEVSALEWKGGGGWGYGHVCPNTECGWWLRLWRWNGKGGEGGDTVVCVRKCRLGRLVWVVDEALALEWSRWVCSRACQNTQVRRAGVGGG